MSKHGHTLFRTLEAHIEFLPVGGVSHIVKYVRRRLVRTLGED